jgi:hypothetical protein
VQPEEDANGGATGGLHAPGPRVGGSPGSSRVERQAKSQARRRNGDDQLEPQQERRAALYDPATGSWSATRSMGTPRAGHTATLLSDGRVLVAGGSDDYAPSSASLTTSAELYHPASGSWSYAATMDTPEHSQSAIQLPDGRVLVTGGSGELYDPGSDSWAAAGSRAATWGARAMLLRDGRVLVAGNGTSQLYDPGSGIWTATGKMVGSVGGPATLLPSGTVLVAGGLYPYSGATASAELYDPGSP